MAHVVRQRLFRTYIILKFAVGCELLRPITILGKVNHNIKRDKEGNTEMKLTEYKYSTARSGLLYAARRARTTVSLAQVPPPMSRICWMVCSKVLPATRFDAA